MYRYNEKNHDQNGRRRRERSLHRAYVLNTHVRAHVFDDVGFIRFYVRARRRSTHAEKISIFLIIKSEMVLFTHTIYIYYTVQYIGTYT